MTTRTVIPLAARDAWTAALDGIPHGFGHTWDSCWAQHLTTGHAIDLHVVEHRQVRIVCPLASRSAGAQFDVYTPYGYAGFVGSAPSDDFPEIWREWARERGYVCGYFGLHPLFHDPSYCSPDEVRTYNSVYVLDLAQPEAVLYAGLSENRRRAIRRPSQVVENTPELRAFFRRHYTTFMASRGAGRATAWTDATLAALCASPDVEMVGAAPSGELEAICVFARTPHAADYLAGVSLPGAEHHSAALIWHAAMRLKQLGVPVLNLGGGITPGDGVAAFKARFGAQQVPLAASTQVYLPSDFTDLCRSAGCDPDRHCGYFPPYRALGNQGAV